MALLDFIKELKDPQSDVRATTAKVHKEAARAEAIKMRVCMPAKVLSYDHERQKADVKPCFKKKYRDGSIVDLPQIFNVPVAHPRAGDAIVHMPLKKDDYVTLMIADRSLEKWLSSGGVVDPEDSRLHNLSDAIAYPGCYPFNDTIDVNNPDDIIVKNGPVEMRIKPNNHFQIINETQEFVKVLDDLVTIIREAVVYTSTGTQQLRHLEFDRIQQRLKTFLEK